MIGGWAASADELCKLRRARSFMCLKFGVIFPAMLAAYKDKTKTSLYRPSPTVVAKCHRLV